LTSLGFNIQYFMLVQTAIYHYLLGVICCLLNVNFKTISYGTFFMEGYAGLGCLLVQVYESLL